MRVLFSAYGAHGHVLPLMGVARAVAGDGHDVLFATAPDLCTLVAASGFDTAVAGLTDEAAVAEAHRRWPETNLAPPSAWTQRMFCEIATPAMAADLGSIMDRWHPDIVVREEGEHGAPVAAAAARLPWVTHGWGSPLPAPHALVQLGQLLAPTWERRRLRPRKGVDLYGATVLDPCPPSLYADQPTLRDRHVVRPTSLGWGGAATGVRRHERRLAYIGFGTVPLFRDAPTQTWAVVEALLALDFDVTVTTGDTRLAEDLRAASGQRIDVERWVDLPQLLESCSLVVCHGGAGTVLAALAAGVPLLLMPMGAASQVRMSAACEARGVGRTFLWNGTNADDLGDALSDVISSERISAEAKALACEIAGMPEPSTAAAVLREVVDGAR